MSIEKKILRPVAPEDAERGAGDFNFWCPACKQGHTLWVVRRSAVPNPWQWDGNVEKPTVQPSLKIEGVRFDGRPYICHLVVTAGMLNYCADCTHELAGKTVPMEPF